MLKVLTPNQIDSYHRDGLLFPLPALMAAEVKYFRACHEELDRRLWGLSEPQLVSAWIALTDSTIDNGCLRALPGTHTRAFEHVEEPQQTNILSRGHTVFGSLDLNKAVDIVL